MGVINKASAMIISAIVLICISWLSPVWAESGEITSVQVAQDLSRISIYSQGHLGKHSAFVIDKPYRLVIDFDSATIGNIKNRIRVEHPPINEIRLGYHNNRARVVVDFGENPVPPYHIEHSGDLIVVSLGKTSGIRPVDKPVRMEPAPKKPVPKQADRTPHSSKQVAQPSPEATIPASPPHLADSQAPAAESGDDDDAKIVVKNAGVKSSLVYVELVNKTDPRISYRLILDLDLDRLSIRSASLSDAKGNIKKFHVTKTETEKLNSSPTSNRFTSGPKRDGRSVLTVSAPDFSGTRSDTNQDKAPNLAKPPPSGWPLRIEAFHPQPKNAVP